MAEPATELPARDEHIAPAPRISIQAFCESVETAAAVQAAGEDRRLGKAHLKIQMGGMAAASEAYRSASTPNVIVLEFEQRAEVILQGLDTLAEVCDPGTRVIVIGRHNDVTLYRELVRRGVSDYLISPVNTLDIVRSICGLYSAPDAKPVGRILAVIGAKGGVGASTIAHNVAWSRAISISIRSLPISIWPLVPRASTTTRTRPRASPMRCSRPSASTPISSTGCYRNARKT
jgi:pilus assembly protein CpaE